MSRLFNNIRYMRGNLQNFKRHYTSALFITDDKANKTFSVLTPYIDFTERVKEQDKLERNIKCRRVDVDLYDVISVWKFYNKYKLKKNDLEFARKNIAIKIKETTDTVEIEKLKAHGKMVKEDLKVLKETYYEIEENAVLRVLQIPNILHENTPEEEKVVHTFGANTKSDSEDHVQVAISKNLLDMRSESIYFFKNDSALFELASTFCLSDILLNKDYVQYCNSDFVRSVVYEGCGGDYQNSEEVFTLSEPDPKYFHENSRLHLVGGASLESFMAYYTKHTIFPSLLPFRFFTVGRKYHPVKNKIKESSSKLSLFNVTQETAVEVFIATKDSDEDMNLEFNKTLKDLIDIYECLNYHFRVCYIPAKDLRNRESLRASFQMFSPCLKRYVEVGNLSICDNYISKRLLFNYGRGLDMNFPRVISGSISPPKILACIIENDYELLSDKLKKYL